MLRTFFPVIYFIELVLLHSILMNIIPPPPLKKRTRIDFVDFNRKKWYLQIRNLMESKLPISSILNICIDVQTAYYLWVFLLHFLSRHPVIKISIRLESKHQLKQLPCKDIFLPMLLFPKTSLMYIFFHIQKLPLMFTA